MESKSIAMPLQEEIDDSIHQKPMSQDGLNPSRLWSRQSVSYSSCCDNGTVCLVVRIHDPARGNKQFANGSLDGLYTKN